MERRHSIIVCEQLPLARINERSSRSFQTGPFWYRFAAAMSCCVSPELQDKRSLNNRKGAVSQCLRNSYDKSVNIASSSAC